MSKYTFRDKVVLITGASSGIGESLALQLGKDEGARLILCARRVERLQAIQKMFSHNQVLICPLDVNDEVALKQAVEQGMQAFKRIDVVIANAGISHEGNVLDTSAHDFFKVMDTNFKAVYLLARATLPHLRDHNRPCKGKFVLISSIMSDIPLAKFASYGASKSAATALVLTLAQECSQVDFTVVRPGFVESEMRTASKGANVKDPVPAFLVMDTHLGAKKIIRGIQRGKEEVIITLHGWFLAKFYQYFPGIFRKILKWAVTQYFNKK